MCRSFVLLAKRFRGLPRTFEMETCLLKSLEWLHYFHYLLELFYIRFVEACWSACHPMALAEPSLTEGRKKLTVASTKPDIRQVSKHLKIFFATLCPSMSNFSIKASIIWAWGALGKTRPKATDFLVQTNKHNNKKRNKQTISGVHQNWHWSDRHGKTIDFIIRTTRNATTFTDYTDVTICEKEQRNLFCNNNQWNFVVKNSLFCQCHQMCWDGMFEVVENFPIHLTA